MGIARLGGQGVMRARSTAYQVRAGSNLTMRGGGIRDALEGGEVTPPPPPGRPAYAQPTPSHCLPDAKCQAQWHL